jgi:cathepsin L
MLKYADTVQLSSQQVIDCSTQNQGCSGGSMKSAFDDIKKEPGICSEVSYPYSGKQGVCKSATCNPIAAISGYVDIPSRNEKALKAAVAQAPVAVTVASKAFADSYRGGVFDGPCPVDDKGTELDRALLLVGYGIDAASGKVSL